MEIYVYKLYINAIGCLKTIIFWRTFPSPRNIHLRTKIKKAFLLHLRIISHELFILLNTEECSTVFTEPSGCVSPHVPTFIYLHHSLYWYTMIIWGMLQHSWLRHCPTSQKVAGTIPNEAIGFFNWPYPSSSNMVLRSTHPLNRNEYQQSPWGWRTAEGWTPHRHLWAECLENVGTSTSRNPTGLHGLLQGYLYLYLIPR
jgi:hypothetical protein